MPEVPVHITLESITLENFKSYYGKVHIGPFDNLTSFIGRNGSGKSNFLDAIAFLLGAHNARLRVQRQSELHNLQNSLTCTQDGNENVTSVSVKFKEKDGSFVTFTRKLVDGVSSGLINDQRLKRYGLDITRSNCLVFQNSLEHLLNVPSHEFIFFFEKIAGVSALKTDELVWHREMTLHRKSEIALKGQVVELGKRLEHFNLKEIDEKREHFRSLLREERNQLLLFRLYHAVKDFDEVPTEVSEEENQLLVAKRNLQEQNELYERKKVELSAIEQEIRQIETDVCLQKNVVEGISQRIREKSAKLVKADATYNQSVSTVEFVRKEISSCQEQVDSLEIQLVAKVAEIACTKEAGLDASEEAMARIREAETAFLAHIPELQELKSKSLLLETSEKQVQNCKELVEWDEKDLKAAMSTVLSLEEDLKQTEKSSGEIAENVTNLTMECEKLESEVRSSRENLKLIEEELESLNKRLALYEENKHEKRKTEQTEQLQQAFGTKAVLGRFIDLVSTKKAEHHLALSRAIGHYNDAVVVDSVATAKCCVEYVKKQLWNRVLFLPLDKLPMTSGDCTQQLQFWTKKPHWPLVSLLDYDFTLKTAVTYVLGKFILCEDFDDAAEVASRIREGGGCINVVSANGTLFKSSGLIRGGQGNAPPVNRREFAQLKQRKGELFDDLRKIRNRLQQQPVLERLRVKMDAMNLRLRTNETVANEIRLKLDVQLSKEIELEEKLEKQKTKLKLHEENLAELRAQVVQLEKIRDEKLKELQQTQFDFTRGMGLFEFKTKCVKFRNLESERCLLEASKCSYENRLKRLENQLDKEKANSLRWQKVSANLRDEVAQLESTYSQAMQILEEQQEKCRISQEALHVVSSAMKNVDDLQKTRESELHLAERKLDRLILNATRAETQYRIEVRSILVESKENEIDLGVENVDEIVASEEVLNTPDNFQFDFSQLPTELHTLRSKPDREKHVSSARERIDKLEKHVRECTVPSVYQEFVQEVQDKRESIRSELKVARDAFRKAAKNHKEVQQKVSDKMREVLGVVSESLNPIYTEIYGDEAVIIELVYATEGDLREQGVSLLCNPPRKRPMPIRALSGGEKALVSIALLFALQKYLPSPIMVLDEVDSALDKKRLSNLMAFLRKESKEKQIVMISHKLDVFVRTDTILGTYRQMDTGHTKIASLNLLEFSDRDDADNIDLSTGPSELGSSL